ncbi:MAG: hypothetical protein V1839_01735 [archaeon]
MRRRKIDPDKLICNIHPILTEYGPLVREDLCARLEGTDTVPDPNTLVQTVRGRGLFAVTIDPKGVSHLFGELRSKTIIYTSSQEVPLGLVLGYAMLHSGFYYSLRSAPMCTRVTRRMQDKVSKKTFAVVRLHYPGAIEQISPANKNFYGKTVNLWDTLSEPEVGFASGINARERSLKPLGQAVRDCVKKNIKYDYETTLKYWKGIQNKYNGAISTR